MVCGEHNELFKSVLRNARLKATPIRLGMLEVFAHQPKPISILSLRAKIPGSADIVTLYRNVETLCKLGLLNRVHLQAKKDYFEFAQKAHHHHLICTGCGKVKDVEDCKVQKISNQNLKNAGFAKINNHQLEFFGICKKCKH
jgi:Fur family ferric uptake transcriptional regulator